MNALLPGFAAATDAQTCFRALLEAMSHPGRIMRIGTALTPPQGLCVAAAGILLTLADSTTGISLTEELQAAKDWLVFHTGARLTAAPTADFVLATERRKLETLRQGTHDAPEAGATLILQLPSFEAGRRVRLSGPGIETATSLDLPLDAAFLPEWQAQRLRNPAGIDVLLCAADQVIALPRSLTMEAI